MARPRKEIPNFVSVDILRSRQIKSTMSAEEFGLWWGKALDDMSVGCIGDDVDPFVRELFDHAMSRMKSEQEVHRNKHNAKKNNQSTALAPVNGSKRNDQLVWGRFENVFLSQDEFNTLATDFGNINFLNQVIESFSASLADGKTQSQNHFATLTRWIAWRKQQEQNEQSRPHYESVSEHNARVIAEGDRWIDEHFPKNKGK